MLRLIQYAAEVEPAWGRKYPTRRIWPSVETFRKWVPCSFGAQDQEQPA
jgi:hypothetical protein